MNGLMVKIPMPIAIDACRVLSCRLEELEKVIVAVLSEDTSSQYYRTLGKEKFDIDSFLISKSPSELLTMRADSLGKPKIHSEKEIEQHKLS